MLLKEYISEYGDGGKTTPEERQREAFNFFRGRGLTPAQASGIVGNLVQESGYGLKTNAVGDENLGEGKEAYGIAQWRLDRKENLKKIRPQDYDTFKGQLEFLWWELNNTEKSAYNELIKAETPEQAAYIFGKKYERPKVVEPIRGTYAVNILNKFGGDGEYINTDTNLDSSKETPTFVGVEGELAGLFADRDKPAPVVTGGEPENIDFFNFAKIKELEDSRIEKEKSILQQMALQEQQEARQRQAQQQLGEQQYEQPQGFNPYNYINIEEY